MPQIDASLLVASTCTGARAGQPEQQRRQLDQPAAADDRVDEPGGQRGQPEQGEDGQGRVVHPRHPRVEVVRIVSLLPSTTEILFAIGAGDDVVGVTFECDYPAEAREPRDRVDLGDARGPDARRRSTRTSPAAMARGEDLYHLDEGALAGLDADLVVTQDLCAVCAVDVSVVDDALAHLGCTAEVLTIDPHTLDEVFESILTLGKATGHEAAADALVADQRERLDAVRARVAGRPRPRVMLLEWTDPPFAPGHWMPEMIEAAGGEPLLGTPGAKSERVPGTPYTPPTRTWWSWRPCGYDRAGAAAARRRAGRLRRPARRRTAARRSTPTRPGPAPAPGSSTASRSSPRSCTRTPRDPGERPLRHPRLAHLPGGLPRRRVRRPAPLRGRAAHRRPGADPRAHRPGADHHDRRVAGQPGGGRPGPPVPAGLGAHHRRSPSPSGSACTAA